MTTPAPTVLTAANTVTCGHVTGGTVGFGQAGKLLVGRQPVLLVDEQPRTVTGCKGVPANGDKPCTTVSAVTAAGAAKLRVGRHPVLLSTVTGTPDGTVGGTPGVLTVTGPSSKLAAR